MEVIINDPNNDDDDDVEENEPAEEMVNVLEENDENDDNDDPNDLDYEPEIIMEDPPNDNDSSPDDDDIEELGAAARPVEARPAEARRSPPQRDDDHQLCTICFEPWTNVSEHRLVSLRCGHLFGRSCISEWLRRENRCPQCNARARKSEIRNIYARSIRVIDTSERDKAMSDLLRETELRRAAELNEMKARLNHDLIVQECERLKAELMEAKKQLQEYSKSRKKEERSRFINCPSTGFSLERVIEVSKVGNCRIVDSSNLLGIILISQPSTNRLFPGYGFRKISTMDLKPSEFMHVHQKPIRDMAFHAVDGVVLTASLDKTLKITNVLTNSVVQTYKVDSDVWSCAWDADDSTYFYGGLKSGEVCVFDIRVTNKQVYELPRFGSRTPVVALQYLYNSGDCCMKNGPIVGKLSDSALHQKTDVKGEYNVVPMPVLGPLTCLSSVPSGHFLASCRPSPKMGHVTHTVCDFKTLPSGGVVCNPITTLKGGRSQLQLTRSKLLNHPDKEDSLLVCAGDEDAHGILIWDGGSGEYVSNLRTDTPVLDLAGLRVDNCSFLTALTDNTLRIYSWGRL